MSAVVDVRDVSKVFRRQGAYPWSPVQEVEAVRQVNLQVAPGEVLALVGQSGSGKTTLARMVMGLEEPTSGSIHLENMRWDGLSERQRHRYRLWYQYVPQDAMSALDPQQTALEHVTETLKVLGSMPREEATQRAMEMLVRLGLEERKDSLPRQMSGGEQRRVTLARVLALEPRLVVADEPTSGLEPDRRASVLEDLIGNLPASAACILVTHDMSAARDWAHRAMVMLEGRVIEELEPRTQNPCHPYARMLFDPWSYPVPDGQISSTGCPFRPDCQLVQEGIEERCTKELPVLRVVGKSPHRVACHHEHLESPPQETPQAFKEDP